MILGFSLIYKIEYFLYLNNQFYIEDNLCHKEIIVTFIM